VTPPDHAHLVSAVSNPITRLVLLGLCVLEPFHWAHRFKYPHYDGLQLQRQHAAINAFCYGGAVLGSAVAAYVLLLYV
jgi:fumarate reductase subunit D